MLWFLHKIGEALDKGSQTDIIYLDLSKAFDSACITLSPPFQITLSWY
jgi:hypothetical protein